MTTLEKTLLQWHKTLYDGLLERDYTLVRETSVMLDFQEPTIDAAVMPNYPKVHLFNPNRISDKEMFLNNILTVLKWIPSALKIHGRTLRHAFIPKNCDAVLIAICTELDATFGVSVCALYEDIKHWTLCNTDSPANEAVEYLLNKLGL